MTLHHIEFEWERGETLHDIYWDDWLYGRAGPLLYCAYVILTDTIRSILQGEETLARFQEITQIARDNSLSHAGLKGFVIKSRLLSSDERRLHFLRSNWMTRTINGSSRQYLLLYIGKVERSKTQLLGKRLFEGFDSVSAFPVYGLDLSPKDVLLQVAPVDPGWDLGWVENVQIYWHKSLLNLTGMVKNPCDRKNAADFINGGKNVVLDPHMKLAQDDVRS